MRDHAVHHVVVTDEQTVIGILSTFDLLEIVEGQGAPGRIPSIATVMTSSPHCVAVDDSVLRARALMVQLQVRHLPVTEGGTLVGVISDRDLKRALDPDLGLPAREELFVRDVYVPGPYTVEGHEPLDRVLEHMAHHHIGSVLVTREDQLVGILTSTDACRLFCEHLRSRSHH